MAKKRLSDVLREEAQKTSESSDVWEPQKQDDRLPEAAAETLETTVETTAIDAEAANMEAIDTEASRVPEDSESEEQSAAEAAKPVSSASHRRASSTKADLESLVAELRTALDDARKTAQATETALQQQVAALQADLQTQQGLTQKLQTDLREFQQLKTELEDAKKMILRLSQVNTKPTPAAEPKPVSPLPAAQPKAAAQPKTALRPGIQAAEPELEPSLSRVVKAPPQGSSRDRPNLHQTALRQILDHPTQPGSLPVMSSEKVEKKESKLSEPDMGWVD
jgi:hypothetical protein